MKIKSIFFLTFFLVTSPGSLADLPIEELKVLNYEINEVKVTIDLGWQQFGTPEKFQSNKLFHLNNVVIILDRYKIPYPTKKTLDWLNDLKEEVTSQLEQRQANSH